MGHLQPDCVTSISEYSADSKTLNFTVSKLSIRGQCTSLQCQRLCCLGWRQQMKWLRWECSSGAAVILTLGNSCRPGRRPSPSSGPPCCYTDGRHSPLCVCQPTPSAAHKHTHSWMTTKRKMYVQTVCLCVQPVCSGHTSSPHHSCCSGSHSPGVLWEPVGPACYMVLLSYHRHSCTKRAVVKP